MEKYIRKKHSIFNMGYHLILSTKYRKPFLHYFDSDLKHFLSIASDKVNISIKEIDIMPDHVHIFFKCNDKLITISKIVQQLKGFSSFSIRNKYPDLRIYKSFWSPSYFIESIGNISEKVIRKYIRNQKSNVKSSYKYIDIVKNI